MSRLDFYSKKIGFPLVITIVVIPAAIWLTLAPLGPRFGDFFSTLTSLGQLSGLTGMALFSSNLILSSRLKIFDKIFDGLDRIYRIHHNIGLTAVLFLLFHPLILATRLIPASWGTAARFLIFSNNWPMNFGITALMLLLVIIVITIYSPWRYEVVRNFHRLLGLPFFLAALHVFFIPSDVARSLPLRYYMLSLAAIGLLAYTYRTVLGFKLIKTRRYRVVAVNHLSNDVVEITMEPIKAPPMPFKAGQFIFVKFKSGSVKDQVHPFTISSGSGENNLRLSIKSLGDFTSLLGELEPGGEVEVEGPYGGFTKEKSRGRKDIWIAGGIGITPFLSMARSFPVDARAKETYLIHCLTSPEQAVFNKELETISTKNNFFKFQPYYSASAGAITAQKIINLVGGLAGADIYLCGPPAMMFSLKSQFIESGVSRKRLHSEEFKLLK